MLRVSAFAENEPVRTVVGNPFPGPGQVGAGGLSALAQSVWMALMRSIQPWNGMRCGAPAGPTWPLSG